MKHERIEVDGFGLHIGEGELSIEGWSVWLNPEVDADFDGLCIADASSREMAIQNAIATLEGAALKLRTLSSISTDASGDGGDMVLHEDERLESLTENENE